MSARPVPQPAPSGAPTDKQVCLYIAEMCTEMERLARRPGLRTLRYLLGIARLESERTGKGMPD